MDIFNRFVSSVDAVTNRSSCIIFISARDGAIRDIRRGVGVDFRERLRATV